MAQLPLQAPQPGTAFTQPGSLGSPCFAVEAQVAFSCRLFLSLNPDYFVWKALEEPLAHRSEQSLLPARPPSLASGGPFPAAPQRWHQAFCFPTQALVFWLSPGEGPAVALGKVPEEGTSCPSSSAAPLRGGPALGAVLRPGCGKASELLPSPRLLAAPLPFGSPFPGPCELSASSFPDP